MRTSRSTSKQLIVNPGYTDFLAVYVHLRESVGSEIQFVGMLRYFEHVEKMGLRVEVEE
jgi:hypothetical protein